MMASCFTLPVAVPRATTPLLTGRRRQVQTCVQGTGCGTVACLMEKVRWPSKPGRYSRSGPVCR